MIDYPLPLLGFAACSGTGKTTLLTQLLPRLARLGLRVGVVKHAHHGFDIDQPGKDSHALRQAGARQLCIASGKRIAWIKEREPEADEPGLREALAALDPDELDLVLVEGFKREAFPKIELHRPALGHPLLYPEDRHIIAVASDAPLAQLPARLTRLDLNDIDAIAGFIQHAILPRTAGT
jgi:molybdopterin-guanine dinucleotide biosynthesis protein MobB